MSLLHVVSAKLWTSLAWIGQRRGVRQSGGSILRLWHPTARGAFSQANAIWSSGPWDWADLSWYPSLGSQGDSCHCTCCTDHLLFSLGLPCFPAFRDRGHFDLVFFLCSRGWGGSNIDLLGIGLLGARRGWFGPFAVFSLYIGLPFKWGMLALEV